MPSLLYTDCLDTVRNDLAPEPAVLTLAQVKMQLVLGYTLCLSQTQAFDSAHVLTYVDDSAFCDLIRTGAIRIVLQKGGTGLAEAFAQKVSDPGFHLCAWPELEHSIDHPDQAATSDRAALALQLSEAAAQHQSLPGSGSLESRWDSLLSLDAAYLQASLHTPHIYWDPSSFQPSTSLHAQVLAARDQAASGSELHHALHQLAAVGGNQRSRYYRHIHQALHHTSAQVQEDLHSIVNLSYNRIVAESLHSEPGLSTYSPAAKGIVEATRAALSTHDPSPVIQLGELNTRHLEHLSWQAVFDLRRIMQHERWDFTRKWEMLQERSIFAASQMHAADGTAQPVVSMLPAAADALASQAISLAAAATLGGPDIGPISALFYYRIKQECFDPVKWLREKIEKTYQGRHQAALISLLREGLTRTHPVELEAHA